VKKLLLRTGHFSKGIPQRKKTVLVRDIRHMSTSIFLRKVLQK